MINVALFGFGRIGQMHAENINRNKETKLLYVYEKIDLLGNKAKKLYEKALKNLREANKNDPVNPDIYNYLGFTERKLGNYESAETYYLIGLELAPKHFGINEYLGELYVSTNRINLANERLEVLKGCNCEEFNELKEVIAGTKESKY